MKPGDKVMVVPVKPYNASSRPGWTLAMDIFLGSVGTVDHIGTTSVEVRFSGGTVYAYLPSWLIPVTETPDGWLVKKLEPKYRPARFPEDYGKRCRVRDSDTGAWEYDIVCGYRRGPAFPWITEESRYAYCEVEDD